MATIIGTTSVGVTTRYALATGDAIYVPAGANVVASEAPAIEGLGSHNVATVAGNVYGDVDGIAFGDNRSLDAGAVVRVLTGAAVSGSDDGVQVLGHDAYVSNLGAITGRYGINIQGDLNGVSRIFNAGTVSANIDGLYLAGPEAKVITNTGTIEGGRFALHSLDISVDRLTNRGSMIGDIDFGGGNDFYDGRGGSVEGTIFGAAGVDTFILGASAEVIDGGSELDVLDFRSTSGIRLALDGSVVNSGTAAGDSFVNVEAVFGSATGADTLSGDAAANMLAGGGGADNLSGAAGADTLIGGAGKDKIWGGGGNDQFWFQNLTDAADTIMDYGNVANNNDILRISVAGFGVGLVAGPLAANQFVARADNLAQDADDRFLFRTTDQTVWFDSNGSAAGGLTMLADLQAGVMLTVADFLLV